MGAPVGGPHQHTGHGRGDRFGERRHQADHTARRSRQLHRGAQVVEHRAQVTWRVVWGAGLDAGSPAAAESTSLRVPRG
ncbi:hypothetical protein SDC9_183270 [bioreactor metagenome]|uniref:Uncharacterized protein n=1 Tax=bioreactor metagenome TaxID=1076179 RepID=A0A645H9S7_9ZZZZ